VCVYTFCAGGGDSTYFSWSKEHASAQTTDELLDPLIPRLRRRVAKAVRENNMDVAEGREFFSITHGWINSQVSCVLRIL